MFIDWMTTDVIVCNFEKHSDSKAKDIQPKNTRAYKLIVPVKNSALAKSDRSKLTANKTNVLWLRPGAEYTIKTPASGPVLFYILEFELTNIDGPLSEQKLPMPPKKIKLKETKFIHKILEDISEDYYNRAEESLDAEFMKQKHKNLVKLVLMEIDEQASSATRSYESDSVYDVKKDPFAAVAYEFQHNPASSLSINKISKQLFMTPSSFRMAFKKRFGQSPRQYLTSCKMKRACRLLSETPTKIKDIAELLGYSEAQLFSTQFKKTFNCTPSQYRQNHLSD